ncbi:MAG: atpH [Verrucomicrobiaceae bacterium]|nr:atpH [Verrucomicrobiaceae bacterium]
MKISKEARRSSRQLFRVCLADGKLDESRVRLVLTHVSSSKPRGYIAILSNFQRLITTEIERSSAHVESATELDAATRADLQTSLTRKYGRPISLTFQTNPELLGGIRVKVGSDVWDGSVKARLEALKAQLA